MSGQAATNGPHLRLGRSDAVTIDGVNYRVVSGDGHGYVLQNLETTLSEAFDHARLRDWSMTGRLEFRASYYDPSNAKTRLKAGNTSLADLPLPDQQIIVRKLEWITRFQARERTEAKLNAGKPRRDQVNPRIGSREGTKKALVEIGKEIDRLDAEKDRPLAEDGTAKKARKPRCGSKSDVNNGPHIRTFRGWKRDYEISGGNPLALRPGTARCGYRGSRFAPELERLLLEYAAGFASDKKPTRAACHRALRIAIDDLNTRRGTEGLLPYPVPSDRTLCKRIAALDMFLVECKRIGVDVATRKHRFITGDADVVRPGQRVEMDEWKVDLFFLLSQTDLLRGLSEEVREKLRSQRWFLCIAIDVATRCILGFHLDRTASVRNASATLEMVISDKHHVAEAAGAQSSYGMTIRPENIITDSGGSFIDERFHLAVIGLGSGHDVPPAGLPHLRGTIERLFRTLSLQLVREFSGQSFENKIVRGEYPSIDRASLTAESFSLAVARYAIDVYHHLPHEGLGGETPANAWKRLTKLYGIIPVPGRNERRSIFGLRLERVVGRHGVRFMGLDYRATILRELYLKRGGITVPIRVDPRNIGQISIEIDGSWHEVSAATSGFDGVTLADHTALCEQLRAKYADQATVAEPVVFEALRAIQARASAAEREATFLTRFAEPEDIDRAERNLMTFAILSTTRDDIGTSDPFAGVIPTEGSESAIDPTGPRPSSTQAPTPKPRRRPARIELDPETAPRPKRSNFRIED